MFLLYSNPKLVQSPVREATEKNLLYSRNQYLFFLSKFIYYRITFRYDSPKRLGTWGTAIPSYITLLYHSYIRPNIASSSQSFSVSYSFALLGFNPVRGATKSNRQDIFTTCWLKGIIIINMEEKRTTIYFWRFLIFFFLYMESQVFMFRGICYHRRKNLINETTLPSYYWLVIYVIVL